MRGLITILGVLIVTAVAGQSVKDTIAFADRPKPSVEFTFGTAFFASKYGSGYSLFFSPRVTYPLTDRFSLRVGGLFRNFSPVTALDDPNSFVHPFTSSHLQSLLMVEGAYKVNKKLTLTGLLYREIPFNSPQDPVRSLEVQGMIMGFDYRVNDHVFIRGQIEFSNDPYPNYFSPGSHPYRYGFTDPFFRTP